MQKSAPDQKLHLQVAEDTLGIACPSANAIPASGQPQRLALKNTRYTSLKNQSGQIVFEYVLLLVIAVSAATLLSKLLVSRNQDSGGVLTSAWSRTINTIGADRID